MSESLYKKAVSNTVKMLLSSGIVFVIQFLTMIILARIYSPDEFGLLSKITIITSFADVFCQLGLGAAIVQKKECTENDYKTVAFTSIILGAITTCIVGLFSVPISEMVKIENYSFLKLIAPAFLIMSISVLPTARLQKDMRFNIIVAKDIISYLCYAVTCIVLGIFGLGIVGLILGLLAKYIISTLIIIVYGKYPLSMKFYRASFMSMFKFGTGFSLCKICSVATDQSDYYAIARTLDNTNLGLYNKAFQLISTPISLIGQGIDQVFFSSFSKIQNDEKRIGDLFISVSAVTGLVCSIVSVCFFYSSGIIVNLLFGKEWINATVPISILSLAIFCRSSIKITDPIMRAKGYVYPRALFHCINTILTVFAAFCGSSYGLLGISIGVVIAQIMNYFINVFYISRKLHIDIVRYMRSTLPSMIITSIAGLIGYSLGITDSIWNGVYSAPCWIFIIVTIVIVLAFCLLIYRTCLDKQSKDEVNRFYATLKSILFKN
ncbi:MAG: lipopolysaccharide biosynthesis protein [Eubacteriales bacterium]|nr:lipopolysaccharide biosynthesis protein [Eubacteriales bacterium]MDD4474332.1 lipopolysaccharide biosynthesis protein [Eubacteriales bacterium]